MSSSCSGGGALLLLRFLLPCILLLLLAVAILPPLCNAFGEHLEPAERERRIAKGRQVVDELNSKRIKGGKWKAAFHERFAVMNDAELKQMLGYKDVVLPFDHSSSASPSNASFSSEKEQQKKKKEVKIAVKANAHSHLGDDISCNYTYTFDARTQWPTCSRVINTIRDQSACRSCWAVSSASVFTDRWCIERVKAGECTSATDASSYFSEAELLSCTPNTYGCDGGFPYYAFEYMKTNGVVTGTNYTWNSGCQPYPLPPYSYGTEYNAPSCSSACTNSEWTQTYSADKKFMSSTGWLKGSTGTVPAIQAEIQANGSVVATFNVYNDFYHYSSGVYKRTNGTYYVGAHTIRLFGWGTQTCSDGSSQDFWLGANSWNTNWGMDGLLLIALGTDECSIESMGIYYGTPNIA